MSEEDFEQKLLSWLGTQGYGLEMSVATTLSNAGCEVMQGHYYEDPETGVSREIDVVGRITDSIGLLKVFAVVECKKSTKPWVLFTSNSTSLNLLFSFAVMSELARGQLSSAVANEIRQDHIVDAAASASQDLADGSMGLFQNEWFQKGYRVGYGITEAFTTREDVTFKAGVSATKAAIALLGDESVSSKDRGLVFLFPTVVLDGRLFECYLADTGAPEIKEIDSGFLLFPIQFGHQIGASVRIVTAKALDRYCRELKSVFHALEIGLANEIYDACIDLGIPASALEELAARRRTS